MYMRFSRQEYRSGLPFPSPEYLPGPGIKPVSSTLAGGFFTTEPPGKSRDETESVILKLHTSKSPGPDGLTGNSTKQRRTYTNPSQTPPKNWRGGNTPKDILWSHHHPDTNTRWRYYQKRYYHRLISLMNRDVKILIKTLANWIQQHMKKIIDHNQVDSFQVHKHASVYANQCDTPHTKEKTKTTWSSQ